MRLTFTDIIETLRDVVEEAESMRAALAHAQLPTSFNQLDSIAVAKGVVELSQDPRNLDIFGWVLPTGHGTGFHQGPLPPECEMDPNPWIPVMKVNL